MSSIAILNYLIVNSDWTHNDSNSEFIHDNDGDATFFIISQESVTDEPVFMLNTVDRQSGEPVGDKTEIKELMDIPFYDSSKVPNIAEFEAETTEITPEEISESPLSSVDSVNQSLSQLTDSIPVSSEVVEVEEVNAELNGLGGASTTSACDSPEHEVVENEIVASTPVFGEVETTESNVDVEASA